MVPLMQVALGLADARMAFEPFSRPVVFLILTSLFLAEALRKYGLTRRLALATIVASRGGVPAVLFGLMAIAALVSMWVENTATAAMLIPVAMTLSRQVADPKVARSFLVLLVLGIAYSASIGGMATVMGSASNAVAAGLLAEIRPWRFTDWMQYGGPALLITFPLTWWLLLRIAPVQLEKLEVEQARQALFKQGRIGKSEWELLATLGVAICLWISGEFLESYFGLPPTLLSAALVGVIAVAYLGIRGILDWEDMKGVSWGIFFTIGAGLSLGDALIRTGVTQWIASLVSPTVGALPFFASLLILVYASAFLTNVLNNTTIAAFLVPIVISLARSDPSLNAVQLVLPVALATTFGYSLPSASGRMALVAASGIVTRNEMMRTGTLMTLANSLALVLYFYALSRLNWI
jgi:sodium-dependent dicarboxylate transporter 2/3/5